MSKIIPVILSGGSGTRLWPLSRKQYPKQFLPLNGKKTMLQETILRLNGLKNLGDLVVVCNKDHRFLVAEQCKQIEINNPLILLEPIGRNTAPAIATAAFQSLKSIGDEILLVLSADQIIQDVEKFHSAINIALKSAKKGKIATFGIKPSSPNTSYGYIEFSKINSDGSLEVENFCEKPDLETAKNYLEEGNYLWNSGMFMFVASTLINQLSIFAPDILNSARKAVKFSLPDLDFIRLDEHSFRSSPSDSIDYALMEKTDKLVVVPLEARWSDLGAWAELYNQGEKDHNNNVLVGDIYTENTYNSYINANHHMIATIGVDDLVIIDTVDATLIAKKDEAHQVKKIVEMLHKANRNEQLFHRKVYRPWGWFDLIETGPHFKVKRLHIYSLGKLSLQVHSKRAEHWVVVKGIATATLEEEIIILKEGDSIYIPIGAKHSLENKTTKDLEIIEVQSGTYLEEDDIIRFDDVYGRKT